ncbi:ABC transporter permease [Tetragenococcus koreensis]|uniref:ABC transporter permease n=1 Tax=Tetragenococcus koreensis TaxID=290335 RepID=UPI000F4FFB53|nr:ABC transporter permease [Tetragenococcus koreensis]AYW45281.1 hypothetical protein C7K43_04610 [Tetragenococcus koreensis]MCF1619488.1 ABC transporter permease [Tetragenococcus koreensis]MCF1656970.1 ABC transporter permease [Tetragenococcus koreensis]GEN90292.1 hypothetical protein TKO01_03380 [Tetragenococcus koreensis]
MLKLIRLEMKKTNFTFYIQRALVASIVITGFLFVMLYFDRDLIPTGSEEFLFITDSITRMVFIIFSGVLISKLIIEEYNNKTITLMFTYPIERKKILIAKLLIIISFTFLSIVITKILALATLSILTNYLHFINENITLSMIFEHFKNTILYDFSASGVSLVALSFGMKQMSVRTTIVASVIIAILLGISNESISVGSFIVVPITLTTIGLVITYLSISSIDQKDVF